MSFTLLQQPQPVSPAYNDLIFLCDSSNATSGSYNYIADVKNGSGTTLAKLKVPIIYGSDYGVFNIQRILESYVTYDFDLTGNFEDLTQNSLFKYEVEFGDDISGTETTNITSITQWVWNAAMTRKDFSTFSSGDWIITDGATAKFLTNRRSKRIRLGQDDWLYYIHYFNPLPFAVTTAKYRGYTSAGVLLSTVEFTITSGIAGVNYQIAKVPSGRNAAAITATPSSGSLPAVHAAASYFTVTLYDDGGTAVTEAYRINLLDECTQHEPIDIYYLNPLGGFDSICFDLVRSDKFTPTRKQMKRQLYELSGTTYEYNRHKHGVANYDTTEKQTVTLNSDWLDSDEVQIMHELISSPVVFMRDGSDYIPVTVLNSDWNQDLNENLVSCELIVELDSERLQRG